MKVKDVQLYGISMTGPLGEQEEVACLLTWDQVKREVNSWEDVGEVGGIEASRDTLIQIYARGVGWGCSCGTVNLDGDDECAGCGEKE